LRLGIVEHVVKLLQGMRSWLENENKSSYNIQRGEGTCASPTSEQRLEFMHCNEHVCAPKSGDILKCKSKVDLVMLLDGSGSVTSDGWAKLVETAGKLIRSFTAGDDGAQVAVMSFSGPDSLDKVRECLAEGSSVNMETDCRIKWESHFSSSLDSLAGTVEALSFPGGGSSMTSAALANAEAELQNGRSDAQQVVLVITDGTPVSEARVRTQSSRLKQKARLIWVPVRFNMQNLESVKAWASWPARDNILAVKSFEHLAEAGTINNIIADACHEVE